MLYRNVKTGAEIETKSIISAPNWIAVGADAPKKAESKAETPKEPETPKEEIKEETKPVKKTAPKKNVKRTKK